MNMLKCKLFLGVFCLIISLQTQARTIPITVTVRSINDIRVTEGQTVRIGTVLAPVPLEPNAPKFTSKASSRAVTKQQAKLAKVKQLVTEHELPEIFIKHEQALLNDLEFEASEDQARASLPKSYQEPLYKSPVRGTVERIILAGAKNGRLNVDILIDIED